MKIEHSFRPFPAVRDVRGCTDSEIDRISSVLFRLCLARGLSRLQAEDVVQDVWLWLLRDGLPPRPPRLRGSPRSPRISCFDGGGRPSVSAAARNRPSRGSTSPGRSPTSPRSRPMRSLDRVARVLPETERSLLVLIRQGNSLARAASMLSIPRGSRSYHRHRLVDFARRELAEPAADSRRRSLASAKPPTIRMPRTGRCRPSPPD